MGNNCVRNMLGLRMYKIMETEKEKTPLELAIEMKDYHLK